jgi:hypothetical protein
MRSTLNIWLAGPIIGISAAIFVATKELFATGRTDIGGVLLTSSVAFVAGVAFMLCVIGG